MTSGAVEAVARAAYFDHVDQHGYPNGMPTWDDLPEEYGKGISVFAREHWLSIAEAAIAAMPLRGVGVEEALEAFKNTRVTPSDQEGLADQHIEKIDFKMLREAVSDIGDDWMSSKDHHQGWVLIPEAKFSQLRVADRIMKLREANATSATKPVAMTSLDAVLALMPEDCFWQVGHDGEGPDPSMFAARVFEPLAMRYPSKSVADTAASALAEALTRTEGRRT